MWYARCKLGDGVALNPFSTGTDDEREAVKIAKKRMLYAEVDRERGIEPGGKTFAFTAEQATKLLNYDANEFYPISDKMTPEAVKRLENDRMVFKAWLALMLGTGLRPPPRQGASSHPLAPLRAAPGPRWPRPPVPDHPERHQDRRAYRPRR